MGLDIYFFERQENKDEDSPVVMTQVAYWRKHNRLMSAVSEVLGVAIENCVDYRLTVEHLDELIRRASDPEIKLAECGEGFFWGREYEYDDVMQNIDLGYFQTAKELIENGKEIYFHAWW